MTISTAVNKYRKQETVSRLKKAYSSLQQALNRAVADYGVIDISEIPNGNGNSLNNNFFVKYLKPYLNISTDCGINTTGTCEFRRSLMDGLDNETSFGTAAPRFYLSDGTFIALRKYANYIAFYIDINGQRKPNTYGKDIFRFDLYTNEPYLKPCASQDRAFMLSPGPYNCNKSQGTGEYCAGVIVYDSWQIKDDYPW